MSYKDVIGITERGDAALDLGWLSWVRKGNPAILITKDPKKLYDVLKGMSKFNIIIHATITGLGKTILEPKVPFKEEALTGYNNLIDLYGIDRVVLRIDPIIPTDEGVRIAKSVLSYAKGRVRISFIDQYPHLKKRGLELPWKGLHSPLEARVQVWEDFGKPEVCGEPGLPCTGCVSILDCNTMGLIPEDELCKQRSVCTCLANKKELLSNKKPCLHNCLYCYWK